MRDGAAFSPKLRRESRRAAISQKCSAKRKWIDVDVVVCREAVKEANPLGSERSFCIQRERSRSRFRGGKQCQRIAGGCQEAKNNLKFEK